MTTEAIESPAPAAPPAAPAPLLGPLSWNLVYVDDLAAMRAFYEGVLGLPVKNASPYFAAYHTGGCTLELMARRDNGPASGSASRGWERNRVLMSFKVENMTAVIAELTRRGATLLHGPSPTVAADGLPPEGQVAQFIDPEGNIFELCDEPLFF
ncbi:VOC family protein [Parafrankia sp. FMc2]|uniref:VOC family protein n=1 Tax=Parafrankia sp. FMc2 TaxID=3233196 RepID=UPI0034D5DD99